MRVFFILVFFGSLAHSQASNDTEFWVSFKTICENSDEPSASCFNIRSHIKRTTSLDLYRNKRYFFIDCFEDKCNESNFYDCVFTCSDWAQCMEDTSWFHRTFMSPCDSFS